MSAAADFLAAIVADPDDDTPRLVFADYLQEHGDADRADFIRLQCELAGLPSWDRRAKELRHHQRLHLARHGRRWLAELPAIEGITWGRFDRGFVSTVVAQKTDRFTHHAAAVRAAAPVETVLFKEWTGTSGRTAGAFPWVRRVGFTDRYGLDAADLERLLDSPLAASARALALFRLGVENAGALLVAKAGHLALDELDLRNCFVGVAGVEALAGAKHLAGLRVLRFGSYGSGYVEDPFVTDEGVHLIARSKHLTNLTELDLGGNQLTDAAVRELLTAKHLAKLEVVNLTQSELTPTAFEVADGPARWRDLDMTWGYGFRDDGVTALARCPRLAGLARLRLRSCQFGDAGTAALADSAVAGELRELYLGDNEIGAEGAYHLAAADWPHLHTLDLTANGIGAEGAKHLGESKGLAAVAELNLKGNKVGDAGAAALAKAGWAGGLRRLGLRANDLGPTAARALAESAHLRGLTALDVAANPLGPKGVAAVAAADWPALTDLHLDATKAGNAGAAAAAGLLGQLVALNLSGCDLGPDGVSALVKAVAPDLGELQVGENGGIGDDLVRVLAAADWPALRSLGLNGCSLTAAGLRALTKTPLYKQLRRLQSYRNNYPYQEGREFAQLEHGDLGPDWVTEDAVEPPEDY